ncbi:Ig-like domain-containing protein [Portibacter lacus]|uniref:SbsA Ig-like domain-containing protein n=1 Tax=Portibacter lacus TaxID=1099794 RepID=A0AA37WEE2_9BACT|nr:Ig-like domain-containing protein [Portibacter lacus]GLR17157.1 hypothetical protein GCM10007940_17720 [Portibacter lacus]
MKNIYSIVLLVITILGCNHKTDRLSQNIITSDIDNFWNAYDRIKATKDTIQQIKILKSLFLDKASEGQKKMIQARNYSHKEYVNVINDFPKFWTSIRGNTLKAKTIDKELSIGIDKLKSIYPQVKPAKIYFTIGALRSNGTTMDSSVLIGTELAFADKQIPTEEFPEYLSHLRNYFDTEPSENLVFLNIHEYIHTQQKTTIGNNLLAQTVLEGVAEFIAEKALNTGSPNPQIQFGKENDAKIKSKFELEMFSPNVYNWIWNSTNNEFGMRDLAYYVGYRICENYYNNQEDKQIAIEQMIQLDYNKESELIEFVEKSNYFSKPLKSYKAAFENKRPSVVSLGEIKNGSSNVKTNMETLTINFSEPMDTRFRNFQLGPLGEENVIRIKIFIGFSEDGKSVSFNIEELEPSKKYQIIVGSGFRNRQGIPLIPYLIEFNTTSKVKS